MKRDFLYKCLSRAVQNEVSVNNYYMRLLGKQSVKYSLPGASRLAGYRLDGWLVGRVINLMWPLFVSPIINLFFLIKSIKFKWGLTCVSSNDTPRVLAFVTGDTTRNVLNKALGDDVAHLYRPRQKGKNARGCDFDSLQFLSFLDLFHIYFSAICYGVRFSYDKRYANIRMYSIFFFDLIVVYRAFDAIPDLDDLCTGDHYDRWAILLDLISSVKSKVRNFSVVQHGALKGADGHFPINLPVKLNSVDCLYCYDEDSLSIFKESIVEKGKTFSVTYFKNSIALSDVPEFEGVIILIVGNSLCYDFHVSVLKSIQGLFDRNLKIFYKPHPAQGVNNLDKEDWQVIMDSQFFPKVDLVISYPSTLADQYKEYDIPVILHGILTSSDDLGILIGKVSDFMV